MRDGGDEAQTQTQLIMLKAQVSSLRQDLAEKGKNLPFVDNCCRKPCLKSIDIDWTNQQEGELGAEIVAQSVFRLA